MARYSPEISQAVSAGDAPNAAPIGTSATEMIEELTGLRIEPTIIGAEVTIGHMALVHSSIVERNVLIGQAAVLVGRNKVGSGTIVGAGAVLPEGFVAPARSLVLGVPARVVREVRDDDARWTVGAAAHYAELSAWYRDNLEEVR